MKNTKIALLIVVIGLPITLSYFLYPNEVQTSSIHSAVLVYNDSGHGSGVVIGADKVLTAAHVAKHNDLRVRCDNGSEYKVISVVFDPNSDAAMLTLDSEVSVPIVLVASQDASIGAEIQCVGTPEDPNYLNALFYGHVVKAGVAVGPWSVVSLVDTHCYAGCSGGPVFYKGRLVGIHVGSNGCVGCILPLSEFQEILSCR